MSQYRIAWLPGDGVGKDVMDATRIVLDALKLDADYVPGDIGWEFWCREGDAFPARTVELLKTVHAAMFGAITSKPVKQAETELVPELRGTGLVYRSPIVRMRQLFDLYICLRPCRAYPGNPLNFKEGIDLVVFRENTEDLYAGVEFNPVPEELAATLARLSKPFAPFAKLATDQYAVSCKVNTKKGSERIVRAAFEHARKFGRKKVTVVHKANVVRATDGLFLEEARKVGKEFPEIAFDEANVDAICMWLLKNPKDYRRPGAEQRRHLERDGRRGPPARAASPLRALVVSERRGAAPDGAGRCCRPLRHHATPAGPARAARAATRRRA